MSQLPRHVVERKKMLEISQMGLDFISVGWFG